MIFQNSMMTLDSVMRITGQMTEAVLAHEKTGRKQTLARACAARLSRSAFLRLMSVCVLSA